VARRLASFACFPAVLPVLLPVLLSVLLSVSATLLITVGGAAAQSFDCRRARAPDELLICRDARLAALDAQMAAAFFRLRRSLPPGRQAQLDAEQQSWLRARASCGPDAACLAAAYERRIRQLIPSVRPGMKIAYGSRGGMEVTVVSAAGLDTAHAVIRTRHTRDDAVDFCNEYVGRLTEKCIADELATPLNDVISADCLRGTFTNFFGEELQFKGRNGNAADAEPRYIVLNIRTGEVENGSSASGYDVDMDIFRALCPAEAPAEP
jgi:uncharacterized protein